MVALNRCLSIPSSLTFLLALSSTWIPTYAQGPRNDDNTLVIALWETTRTVTALGTLRPSNLPADCFSLEQTRGGTVEWFQGCDAASKRSCCPDGYSTGGFYTATECPQGYTPRPTGLDTVLGTPVVYTFSVDRTKDAVSFCCPTPNPRAGWQEYGFFMSDWLMCDWISADTQSSITSYQRGAASAIVILSTGLPSSTSADSTSVVSTSRSTEGNPTETSASVVGGSSSGGMSNGAIIGIAVGVGLPVLALLGFLIYKFGGGKKEEGGGNPGVEDGGGGGVGGMMY